MSEVIVCKAITYRQAYDLVSKFHYLGNKRFIGQFCYGIFENQILVGAVVYSPLSVPESAMSAFGLPRGHYPDLVEMSRMVLSPRHNGANYGSQLIGYSLRQLKGAKIRAVITYADSSRHYGAIYQACNFAYYGLTAAKKDFYLNDGQKLSRGKTKGLEGTWKPRSRKHRYLYIFDKSLSIRWQREPYPKMPNRSAVPNCSVSLGTVKRDTPYQTVPPFPPYKGEQRNGGTVPNLGIVL